MGYFYNPPQTGTRQPCEPPKLQPVLESTVYGSMPPFVHPGRPGPEYSNILAAWQADTDLRNQTSMQEQPAQRFGKVPTAVTAITGQNPIFGCRPNSPVMLETILTFWQVAADALNAGALENLPGERFQKTPTPITAIWAANPPFVKPGGDLAKILGQWAQLQAGNPAQAQRFIADLLSSSNPVLVSVARAIMGFTGQASHANEIDSISKVPMGFTGQASHANEVDIVSHATMAFSGQASHLNEAWVAVKRAMTMSGQASHLNEAVSVGKAVMAFTGRNVSILGASLVSVAMVAMGFVGGSVTASNMRAFIEAVWANVWSMWTSRPNRRGY